jgi:predicted RNase H-like HicB family nuclease
MIENLAIQLGVIIEPDGDSFHAYCPALKGLHSSGDTEEEALQNARDAAMAYLRSLIKHGDPLPVGCVVLAQDKLSRASHRCSIELVLATV